MTAVLMELRWRAVPFLVPLGVLAVLPSLLIWVAALVGSVGFPHPLDVLPNPGTASTPLERHTLLAIFWIVTLGGPLVAFFLGAAGSVDADLRTEPSEIGARIRLPAPPWTGRRGLAVVLLAVEALLFMAMAGHLADDCLFGGDCLTLS